MKLAKRVCLYSKCQCVFEPIKHNQKYCCAEHRDTALREKYRKEYKERKKRQPKEMSGLAKANEEARAHGMTYGKWQVHKYRSERRRLPDGQRDYI